MGHFLPLIAIDPIGIDAFSLTQIVRQYAGTGALLPIHIAHALSGDIRKAFDPQRIALLQHQSLLAPHAAHQINAAAGEILFDILRCFGF